MQVLTTVHQRYDLIRHKPEKAKNNNITFFNIPGTKLSGKMQRAISFKNSACKKMLRCKNFGVKQASGQIGGSRPPDPPPGSATVKAYYDKKIPCLQNIIMLNFNPIFFVAKLLFEWSFSRKSSQYPEYLWE